MSDRNRNLITHYDPKNPIAEAFRTLRTNLQFASLDRELRSLVVTSGGPGEGKSTICSNLAIALAQAGRHILLVDADLRRPTVHKRFEVPNTIGLTGLIVNGIDGNGDEAFVDSGIENLSLLPSGPLPPNPSEILGSKAMDKVIKALESKFDMVIYDCPPLIAVTDACVLAGKVGGVIMVIELGKAEKDMTRKAISLLRNVKANILGAVVNNVDINSGYGLYYYYYYYDDDKESGEEYNQVSYND